MWYDFNFFNRNKQKFAHIELDALLSQSITMTNIVSEHPLETGELLNDAIHNQPLVISFSALVSDMPQSTIDFLKTNINAVQSVLSSKSMSSSKSMKAWVELNELWKAKELVTITSPMQSEPFDNMSILKIHVEIDDLEGITFSVDLKQVQITQNLKKFTPAPEVGKQSTRL
ncbi:MAG: hypothetical protein PF437_04285 [Sulfurimonas sp.]|jgi:hypothetical protein|nr:hypothetical protein [Sulfurimonas sp.]